jgi:DNA-directed RNA polymerase specialized sigma24 family protein
MQTLEQANNYAAALYGLAFLLTGDRERSMAVTLEVLDSHEPAWLRRVVIANALAGIREELVASARRTALQSTEKIALPSRNWILDSNTTRVQIERALLAIDVFPRCAILLTLFEGISVGDAALLLDCHLDLVRKAQIIGLREMTRNLARMQGWIPATADRRYR